MIIEKGFLFKDFYGYKCHVVAILKDEPRENYTQIVYKYYGRRKQWWHYETIDLESFLYYIKKQKYKLY